MYPATKNLFTTWLPAWHHISTLYWLLLQTMPMPQTTEHLEILSLLGVATGTIALTKCDLVSSQRLSSCRDEISALTHNTFLQEASLLRPVQKTPPDTKHSMIICETAAAERTLIDDSSFRLAIDRAFTVKGAGVVVTGTVHCGTLAADQQ